MPFVVDFLQGQGVVCLTLNGSITKNELESSREDVRRALNDNTCRRLLIDMTGAEPQQSLTQDFQFTSELHRHFPAGTRIAIIVPAQETERMEFVKDVASNRGVRMCIFQDNRSALSWLVAN